MGRQCIVEYEVLSRVLGSTFGVGQIEAYPDQKRCSRPHHMGLETILPQFRLEKREASVGHPSRLPLNRLLDFIIRVCRNLKTRTYHRN